MQPHVKIYTLSTCGHCKAAKKFLDACNVQYECTDVDQLTGDQRQAVIEEVRRLTEGCSFPTIVIGSKVIVGFQEKELRAVLGI